MTESRFCDWLGVPGWWQQLQALPDIQHLFFHPDSGILGQENTGDMETHPSPPPFSKWGFRKSPHLALPLPAQSLSPCNLRKEAGQRIASASNPASSQGMLLQDFYYSSFSFQLLYFLNLVQNVGSEKQDLLGPCKGY